MDIEHSIIEWFETERREKRRVTTTMIRNKAKYLHQEKNSGQSSFKASRGWLRRFFKRQGLSLRRKTTQGQHLPSELVSRLTSFIAHLRLKQIKHAYPSKNVVTMDETACWFDCVSDSTVEKTGAKDVQLKTTGHEKQRYTVILAARADGTKELPCVVFKGKGKRVEPELKNMTGIRIYFSDNGWMNSDLTERWLQETFAAGALFASQSGSRQLLVWDAYRCHVCPAVRKKLAHLNGDMAVIPAGCTGLIQAADVSWNAPFKSHMRELYDNWMSEGAKTYTAAGNIRAPTKATVALWVKQAWARLKPEIIAKSLRCCAVTLPTDGSCDGEITCLKEERLGSAMATKDALDRIKTCLEKYSAHEPDDHENDSDPFDSSDDSDAIIDDIGIDDTPVTASDIDSDQE